VMNDDLPFDGIFFHRRLAKGGACKQRSKAGNKMAFESHGVLVIKGD
jgi:hypothetical protein